MKSILNIILLSLMVIISPNLHAQHQDYIQITDQDGLPSNTIFDVAMDRHGHLWLATDKGVTKYDGKSFKTFTTADGLPTNEIWKVYIDKYDRVWTLNVNSYGHYIRGDSVNVIDCFYLYRPLNRSRSPQSFAYFDEGIAGFDNNSILIPQADSILYFAPHKTPSSNKHSIGDSIFHYYVSKPFMENPSILKGYLKKDSAVHQLITSSNGNNITVLTNEFETVILDYQKGQLIHCLNNEIHVFPIPKNLERILPYTDGRSLQIPFPDQQLIYDLEHRTLSSVEYHTPFQHTRSITFNDFIISGTLQSGLIIFNGKIHQKNHGDQNIKQMCLTEGTSYLLDYNNVLTTIKSTGHTSHQSIQNSYPNLHKQNNICYLFNYNEITNLNTQQKLPALTLSDSAISDFSLRSHIHHKRSLNSNSFLYIDDTLMIKSNRYISFIGKVNRTEIPVKPVQLLHIYDILKLPNSNKQLISTETGSYLSSNISSAHQSEKINDIKGRKLIRYNNDSIYYFTSSKIILDYQNDTTHIIDNLYNDIQKIAQYDSLVFFTTSQGLNKFNLKSGALNTYSFRSFFSGSNIIDFDIIANELIFSDGQNIKFIALEDLKNPMYEVHLTTHLNDTPLHSNTTYYTASGPQNITIEFYLDSPLSFGRNTYYYKLEPGDKEWQTTTSTTIKWAQLANGNYKLKVKGIDDFGNESTTKLYSLTIPVPWYSSVWFYILITLLSSASIVSYILINQEQRRKAEREQNEIKKRFASLELDALRAQMNPHFIFNSLSAIQAFIRQSNKEAADDYLSKFAILIRTFLDQSRSRQVRLSEEIKLLQNYVQLENLRIGNSIQTEWTIDPEIDTYDKIPSLLLQPFIENAINHGLFHKKGHKQLTIKFDYIEDGLLIQIIDNGIGRHASKKINQQMKPHHESKGMTIIEERIATINTSGEYFISYSIHDLDSATQTGTHVTVIIKQL